MPAKIAVNCQLVTASLLNTIDHVITEIIRVYQKTSEVIPAIITTSKITNVVTNLLMPSSYMLPAPASCQDLSVFIDTAGNRTLLISIFGVLTTVVRT